MAPILTKEQVRKKYKALFARLVTPIVTLNSDACEFYIDLCETSNEERYRKAVGDFASALLFIYRHFNKRYNIKRGTVKTFLLDALTDEQLREIETILLKSDMFVNLEDVTDMDILDPEDDGSSFLLKKFLHVFMNFDLTDTSDVLRSDSKVNQGYEELEDDDDVDGNIYHLAEAEIHKTKKDLPRAYTKPYEQTKQIFQEVMSLRGLKCYDSLFDDVAIEF